ncbi:MAG: hypothetical protein ACRC6T_01595 [Sarcina sp.]
MSDFINRREFEEYKSTVDARFNLVEYEILRLNYSRVETEEILRKIARRDYSWSDKNERNQLILALSVLGIMTVVQMANKFDLSAERVREIIAKA